METEQTVDTDLVVRWIEALESGRYTQTTGVLHDDNGYCCLGVLCDIVDPTWREADDEHPEMTDDRARRHARVWDGTNELINLPEPLQHLVGLDLAGTKSDRSQWFEPYTRRQAPWLTSANDVGWTFTQIAAALRIHYGIPEEIEDAA